MAKFTRWIGEGSDLQKKLIEKRNRKGNVSRKALIEVVTWLHKIYEPTLEDEANTLLFEPILIWTQFIYTNVQKIKLRCYRKDFDTLTQPSIELRNREHFVIWEACCSRYAIAKT